MNEDQQANLEPKQTHGTTATTKRPPLITFSSQQQHETPGDVEEGRKGDIPKEIVDDDSTKKDGTSSGSPQTASLERSNKERVQAIQDIHDRDWLQRFIIFPSSSFYVVWFIFSVVMAVVTFFFETYQIAFPPAGLQPIGDPSSILHYLLIAVYFVDIAISFNLAYFNEENELVYTHWKIAKKYFSSHFFIDLVGALPIYRIVLGLTGLYLVDNTTTQYLGLLRLLRLSQVRRVKLLFDIFKFSTRVSLMNLTLIRNGTMAVSWSHFAACTFYFISKQYDFDPNRTWIGPQEDLSRFEVYTTTLFSSLEIFTGGGFRPINSVEQIFGMIYLLINIIIMSYIIGSITLLVVKNDEATGMYRDNLQALFDYCTANDLVGDGLYNRLKTQLKVEFNYRDAGDEMVLSKFPKTMRQKVLYRLYSPALEGTNLMRGIREHFMTDFLTNCRIVTFSSGEELLSRGAVSSDLFLLVEGAVQLSSPELKSPKIGIRPGAYGQEKIKRRTMENRDFINEISFFTESRQIDTVKTLTICKTLIISKSDYNRIADDHPGSVGRILNNLLAKVRAVRANVSASSPKLKVPSRSDVMMRSRSAFLDIEDSQGGSVNDDLTFSAVDNGAMQSLTAYQSELALSAIQQLVEMHINKKVDDNTTRFLFAASRDDVATIRLMCDQGFDPDCCDYSSQSALIVASMKGNVDAVQMLLEYGADPSLKDKHGTTALLEAINHGHDEVIEIIVKENGSDMSWMDEATASTLLIQTVVDGNISKLERYLKGNINLDAGNCDKRTALHVAASEGNFQAARALVEAGAQLQLRDRWNNQVVDEAKRTQNFRLLQYFEEQIALRARSEDEASSTKSNVDE